MREIYIKYGADQRPHFFKKSQDFLSPYDFVPEWDGRGYVIITPRVVRDMLFHPQAGDEIEIIGHSLLVMWSDGILLGCLPNTAESHRYFMFYLVHRTDMSVWETLTLAKYPYYADTFDILMGVDYRADWQFDEEAHGYTN